MFAPLLLLAALLPGPIPHPPAPDDVPSPTDRVRGAVTVHRSPGGVEERCVRIESAPGGRYSDDDREEEEELCALDLYAPEVGLCPKTWSTSPGMVVYDLTEGPYVGDREGFWRRGCAEGHGAKELTGGTHAKFKPTMNGPTTSATFSASSLLYYHFSRYFHTVVEVPPAVWRSMDRQAHLEVAESGLIRSGHGHSSKMNHDGWRTLVDADRNPESYRPTDELFTADRTQIYGVMLDGSGTRYNSEINGTRESGWGRGQNLDFQETAPFRALRSGAPLRQAIAEGLRAARSNPKLRRDMGADTTAAQMVFWMRELSEIVLLDFIFSQQDRVGNIDYKSRWYWVEDGEVRDASAPTHGSATPPTPGAVRIKRSHINDNDAGGRIPYANFAKSTGMLEKLRHFDAGVYRRLQALHADFEARGTLHDYVENAFGLSARQVAQVVDNTALAAAILRRSCEAGELRFDLEPETFLLTGDVAESRPACSSP